MEAIYIMKTKDDFERYLEKQLEDPEFKEAWDALEPEYEKIRREIKEQNKQHWLKKKYYRNIDRGGNG